jgi:hypothetical protein
MRICIQSRLHSRPLANFTQIVQVQRSYSNLAEPIAAFSTDNNRCFIHNEHFDKNKKETSCKDALSMGVDSSRVVQAPVSPT